MVLVPSLDISVLPAVLRAFEERSDLDSISAALVLDWIQDSVNPSGTRPGYAFLAHHCYVVQNRRGRVLPAGFWKGWPTYKGPDHEWWKKLTPVTGEGKRRVLTKPVYFRGKILTLVPG